MKGLALLLTVLGGAGLVWGQAPGSNQSQVLLETTAPGPVVSVNAQVSGTPGYRQFFYWVVANYPVGKAVPAGPAQVNTAPNTLTVGNYVAVTWAPVTGATSYDVLRTTSPVLPNTTANIAVATAVVGTSFNNTAETINSYTISAATTAQDFWRLDNRNYQLPVTLFGSAPIVPSFIGTTLPSRCVRGQQFFKTDATPGGNLYLCTAEPGTWTAVSGGGGGTSPGGSDGDVQYNNAGAFGGDGSFKRIANGRYTLYDPTGPTTLTVRAGSANSTSTAVFAVANSGGTTQMDVRSNGEIRVGGDLLVIQPGAVRLNSTSFLGFSSSASPFSSDTGLARASANNLGITNGSSTTYWGLGANGIVCLSPSQTNCDVTNLRNLSANGTLTGSNLKRGNGSPESVISGIVGDLYQRLDGGTGTTLYIKEAGVGTTGWVAVSSGGGGGSSSALTDLLTTKTSPTVLTIQPGRWGHGNASMAPHAGTLVNITSLTISGATNATPIKLTVSSITSTSLRTGDTVNVSGVTGNTAANGTWSIEIVSSTEINLTGSVGNGAYGGGGTVAGTGSGTMKIYGTPDGNLNVLAPASAGLVLTCPTVCIMNQAVAPDYPVNATQVATVTITAGAWDTVTDDRRFLNSGWSYQQGGGINIANAAGEATFSVDSTVARTTGTNQFTGSNDFTPATRTAPNRTGAGAPAATCTVGDTYFRTSGVTAGQNLYLCTATNTWTQVTGGSGSSSVMFNLPFGWYNATSTAWDSGWNFSDTMVNAQTVGNAACPATSSLAECGIRWYSLADASQRYATNTFTLPANWTSGTVTFSISFGSNGSTDPVLKIATKCYTSGSTPPAYNPSQTLPSGTVAAGNSYTRTIALTTTGCAGGRPMTIQLTRDDNTSGFILPYVASVEVQVP